MKRLFASVAGCLMLLAAAEPALAAERAASKYTETAPGMTIEASWQRFGMDRPDDSSDALVQEAVRAFRSTAAQECLELKELRQEHPDYAPFPLEMVLTGVISDNGKTTGILWKNYQYLGGAHGNLGVFTRNYTVPDGRAFTLTELFRRPDTAVRLFSELSRRELIERGLPADMVDPGTEPDIENFSAFLLSSDGIVLYFNPYQVAPWSEGVVTVTLSLDDLSEAGPHTAYWK